MHIVCVNFKEGRKEFLVYQYLIFLNTCERCVNKLGDHDLRS